MPLSKQRASNAQKRVDMLAEDQYRSAQHAKTVLVTAAKSPCSCGGSVDSRIAPILRLALTPDEAATSLGVSRSFFYEHILPDLRVIRLGRKRLIPVPELERWTERSATRTLD